jgi:hypothetical protein
LVWQAPAYSATPYVAPVRHWRHCHAHKCHHATWARHTKAPHIQSLEEINYLEFEKNDPTGEKKQTPTPEDNSSDSSTDLDESDNALDDVSMDTVKRTDHKLGHSSLREVEVAIVHPAHVLQFFLPPDPSFYCLHQHIRERAPPGLG